MRAIRTFLVITLSFLLLQGVQAAYPDKPIKVVIGFPAGGPLDAHIRLLADKLQNALGQPVIGGDRNVFAVSIFEKSFKVLSTSIDLSINSAKLGGISLEPSLPIVVSLL